MSQVLLDATGQGRQVLKHSRVLDGILVVGASLLMAVCAHVSIPLWFTPVPITLQTFGVVLLALTLGPWRASAALVLYLLEGISGLPVFSPHGPGGTAQLLGPTGGYLMAYPVAATVGGLLAERSSHRSRAISFALGALTSDAIILSCGAVWLMAITHRSPATVLLAAVLPFLPGEILKSTAAVASALGARQLRK